MNFIAYYIEFKYTFNDEQQIWLNPCARKIINPWSIFKHTLRSPSIIIHKYKWIQRNKTLGWETFIFIHKTHRCLFITLFKKQRKQKATNVFVFIFIFLLSRPRRCNDIATAYPVSHQKVMPAKSARVCHCPWGNSSLQHQKKKNIHVTGTLRLFHCVSHLSTQNLNSIIIL